MQLEIEREALKKEKDDASKQRCELDKELAELKEQSAELKARWQAEKEAIQRKVQKEDLRDQVNAGRARPSARATTEGGRDALRRIPETENELPGQGANSPSCRPGRDAQGGGGRRRDRRRGEPLDRHPRDQDAGGRAREAAAHGGRPAQARGRPGRGGARRGRRRAPQPRRPAGPEPAHRQLHLPGPTGVGKTELAQGAGRVPVRRRARHGAHRHERVHGEALRLAG
jgi:ATP-dependent Clp protease ATP-binding subunit ClpB